jgi:starvation-inducible DNA-binding protein
MYSSPSRLPADRREAVTTALQGTLSDLLDLHGQVKVAHWNIKGPLFPTLHPLFDTIAQDLSARIDEIAERAVALGAHVHGTAGYVTKTTRLTEYPQETVRDLELTRLLAERIEVFLDGARQTREVAAKNGDTDTGDMMTVIITEYEKQAWFLRSTTAT